MADWQTLSHKTLHETPWIKLQQEEVLNHNGKPMTLTYLELQHPSVSIIATDDQGRILLQQNYRPIIKQTVWEIPAGHSDGQDLLIAAKRELQEEAGMASDDWAILGNFYTAAGVANIPQTYFLARNVYPTDHDRDEDEQITNSRFFTIEQIEAMLADNTINTYMAPIGVYLAKLRGVNKKEDK